MNEQQGFSTSSHGLMAFIMQWWKPIGITTLVGGLLAFGVSYAIKPRFKSTAVFYPAVTQSVSNLMDVKGGAGKDFLVYGEEEEAERVIQILSANEIREYIIEQYNLWEHYDISRESSKARTKMYKKYKENISFRRTEYNSVEISVLDTDPERAAGMANDLVFMLDSLKNRIQQERAAEGLRVVQSKYHEMGQRIQTIGDSLSNIRAKGVNDYESQSEVLNKELAAALAKNNQAGVRAIQAQLDTLSKYGSAYLALSGQLELLTEQQILLERKLEEVKADAESSINQIMPIDYGYPADSKTYPKRILIAIGASFFSFVLSVFFLIFLQNYRGYKGKLKRAEAAQD